MKRADTGFVQAEGTQFTLNGKPFNFIGTNAYWLTSLNDSAAVKTTLQTMKAQNATVIRVWAFNDVTSEPTDNSTFFQIFKNGVPTVNTGSNGLQRLDNVISIAEEEGLKVLLTTTNNWNPTGANPKLNSTFPRGFLSNDYGGMDTYVSQIRGENGTHDDFYTNDTVKNAYKAYLNVLIPRYASSKTVIGWEIANDPRCNSSLKASPSCKTTTVTSFVSEIAQHISALDPNHLLASGAAGFLCMPEIADCPKLFQKPPPPPVASPALEKRHLRRGPPLTKKSVMDIRNNIAKRRALSEPRDTRGGVAIRGRWVSAAAKRQASSESGSALDGSQGVDSEDISSIPQIGFSTFQVFTDQNTYAPPNPNLNNSENTLDSGTGWIATQGQSAQSLQKPTTLTGFGVVTTNNANNFVPFNSSETVSSASAISKRQTAGIGVTDPEQATIYSQWVTQAIQSGVSGILQYQWGQNNLPLGGGGGVVTSTQNNQGTSSGNGDSAGVSPNDGYSALQGTTEGNNLNAVFAAAAAEQAILNSQ